MKLLFTLVILGLVLLPARADAVHLKSSTGRYDVATDRIAHIVGPVTQEAADRFDLEMLETTKYGGHDRIILIDSPGGSVDAGKQMQRTIDEERSTGVRIVCVVVKAAHSMGFNILTHCDIRLATERARMLVHKVEQPGLGGGMEGQTRNTAHNLRQLSDNLDRVDEPFRQANAKAMHLSLHDYDLLADNETFWTAQMLLAKKYLHDLAEIKP